MENPKNLFRVVKDEGLESRWYRNMDAEYEILAGETFAQLIARKKGEFSETRSFLLQQMNNQIDQVISYGWFSKITFDEKIVDLWYRKHRYIHPLKFSSHLRFFFSHLYEIYYDSGGVYHIEFDYFFSHCE